MHEETKRERERIFGLIHDFCRGESMTGKACVHCVINSLNVCNEQPGSPLPMERLRNAERIINEVLANEHRSD